MKQEQKHSTTDRQQTASVGPMESHVRLKQSQEELLNWLNTLEKDSGSKQKAYQYIR